MNFAQIILDFLGIQDVTINDIKIWKKKRKIQIFIQQKRETSHCQHCGLLHGRVHEWESKTLKAPPLGAFNDVTVFYKRLRAFCFLCDKNTLCIAEFIHPKFKNYLCSFAETAGRLMEETTCEAASRLLKANSKSLWSLDQWRLSYLFEFMKLPENLDLSYMSADEVHFRSVDLKRYNLFSKKKDIQFITNLVCYKERKILFNGSGRSSDSLIEALSILSKEQKESIKYFAVDMHDPFMFAIKKECPNAKICVDRFHVILSLNKAMDKLRLQELREAAKMHQTSIVKLLSSSRKFILFEKKSNLVKSEIKMLESLRKRNVNINNGLLLMDYFHKIMDKPTVKTFRASLNQWYELVRESKLKPFRVFAKSVRRFRREIEAYIESGLTTGLSEGLNNKIKVLRRVGYGYSNEKSFRLKILQRCGFLNSAHISADELFYKVA